MIKKVCPQEFQERDYVLNKILPIQKDHKGKWTTNYEGPYVKKKKAFSKGALILTNMDGEDLSMHVNSIQLKGIMPRERERERETNKQTNKQTKSSLH